MEELELSLVASEPRRLHSVALDVLQVGDRIALVSDDLLADSDAVDTTLRDDRAKGLWKQNIARLASFTQGDLSGAIVRDSLSTGISSSFLDEIRER